MRDLLSRTFDGITLSETLKLLVVVILSAIAIYAQPLAERGWFTGV